MICFPVMCRNSYLSDNQRFPKLSFFKSERLLLEPLDNQWVRSHHLRYSMLRKQGGLVPRAIAHGCQTGTRSEPAPGCETALLAPRKPCEPAPGCETALLAPRKPTGIININIRQRELIRSLMSRDTSRSLARIASLSSSGASRL